MKLKIRKFSVRVVDPTAVGGISKITFDPYFDRVPSTKEFVDSKEKARQYCLEVLGKEPL